MTKGYRSILHQILTIIGYEDSKDAFIDKFISLCLSHTIINLTPVIPKKNIEEINKSLKASHNTEFILESLKKFVSPEKYAEELEKTTSSLFSEYIKTIMPTLKPEQKTQLITYLSSL